MPNPHLLDRSELNNRADACADRIGTDPASARSDWITLFIDMLFERDRILAHWREPQPDDIILKMGRWINLADDPGERHRRREFLENCDQRRMSDAVHYCSMDPVFAEAFDRLCAQIADYLGYDSVIPEPLVEDLLQENPTYYDPYRARPVRDSIRTTQAPRGNITYRPVEYGVEMSNDGSYRIISQSRNDLF